MIIQSIIFFLLLHDALGDDFLGESDEGIMHVHCSFCRGLQEFNAQMTCKVFSLLSFHLPAGFEIRLVSDKYLECIRGSSIVNFRQPDLLNARKRLAVSDIIDEDDSCCSLVVCGSYTPESFLASDVPDLQLDTVTMVLNFFAGEFHSDCCFEAG